MRSFRLAATAGDARVVNDIGVLHEYGLAVPKDSSTAFPWYDLVFVF